MSFAVERPGRRRRPTEGCGLRVGSADSPLRLVALVTKAKSVTRPRRRWECD